MISRRFDSVAALVDYASATDYTKTTTDASDMLKMRFNRVNDLDAEWFGIQPGTVPMTTAQSLAAHGWPEGVERIRESLDNLGEIIAPVSIRRRRVWADQGDAVDMGKVWAGNCESAWSRTARLTTRAPAVVTIWIPLSISYKAAADALFWRGAALVAVADALTTAGYSVGINAYKHDPVCVKLRSNSTKKQRGDIVDIVTTVKAPDAPLDVSTLAACVANPCFIRGLSYAATIRAACEGGQKIMHGLAWPSENDPPYMPATDIGGLHFATTQEAARRWCNETLARFGSDNRMAA